MFGDETVLNKYREKANKAFILSRNEEKNYLSQEEEMQVLGYFEAKLAEFCTKFKPPMPKAVKGTAFHYFKRFYLKNSIMDYHPKEILVTSVYLATKVEEFNVSITQFVANVQGNQERATKIILNNELLLLKELNFNLTIHNPFRAVEGLLIDLKTRCSYLENVDSFRPDIDTFLDQVFLTDAVLIYAPAQIALAAIIHAASRQKQNLDSYVTDLLFKGQGTNAIRTIVTCVRQIRILVKEVKEPVKGIKALCEKLEACRNQDNNPDSAAYKRKLEELIDEDDALLEEPVAKSFRMDSDIGVKVLSPGAN
ncbi:cyclin-H-like isoform X1 [Eurytemora carolleeae]|uniref:cyclin-H-like isoform X1 n=1 Tax=Eurytemora carolleeae TaxID=1294199 RepID=UPI000C76C483|nr:cyclin-H-like isoform X1 [Eurytemora carolleeae]|eukprot:XP_023338725.1 cyclin-H-like isoform X1 [Eurytemora affinis]